MLAVLGWPKRKFWLIMPDQSLEDPYALHPESIEVPPTTFLGALRRIGPALIIGAGVVGTGELIATTVLGAEIGYTLLWFVLVSCIIKVVVQNELGRYAIGTGETGLEAMDRAPGPRFRVSWLVWSWSLVQAISMTTHGGMFAGISEVLNQIIPAVSVGAWVWIVMVVTLVLLLIGRYSVVERVSVAMVIAFTATTASAAVLLLTTPAYFSWSRLLDGLAFHVPEGGLVTAVAVFGITGMGATDLIQYPYWCIEKGYARFTGPRDSTAAWMGRARGWVRVMGVDVLCAMVIYTFSTVAFYLLGAGVLHGLGVIPQGTETIRILSSIYTEMLGDWSRYVFLVGAIAVLYSSLFAGTAATARMYADFAALMGAYDGRNYEARLRATRIISGLLLVGPVLVYIVLRDPVRMVLIGGVGQALMLPVVGFSTLYLRYVHLPKTIVPKGWITLALWVASLVMLVMMGYSVLRRLV